MKQILCLADEPWSSVPGRTQQLVSRLRDTQVLYFEPAGGRRDRRLPGKGRRVRPNVTVYTLPPRLLEAPEQFKTLFRAGQRRTAAYLTARAEKHRFREPLLWTTRPEQVHLLDFLSYGGLVYDCDRVFDDLPPQWEGSLAQAADVVFAASPHLVRRLAPCSGNIALLPNGVNYPLFSADVERRDPLPQVRGPVLGWAGTVRDDLDLDPLLYAARSRPDWSFLLLGRVEEGRLPRAIWRQSNILCHGACPVDEVPDWLYRCDVLLELLREDRPYDGVVSPRLYEYLSTGKPVVSMLWPDQVEPFPDVVYAAHDEPEFLTMCQHALEEAEGFVTQRRMDYGAAAAWPLRAGEVARILSTAGLL